jgi:hypothetical protein
MPHRLSADYMTVSNETVPVPDAIFARVCRSNPTQARELAVLLGPSQRAQLALFCNARSHLRDVGRAIASMCSEDSLIREGGHAGRVLFSQVKAGPETWGMPAKTGPRQITLAH